MEKKTVKTEIKNEKNVTTTVMEPFVIISVKEGKEKKHFITCGKLKLPKEYKYLYQAKRAIKKRSYEVIALLVETFEKTYNKK